MFCILYDINKTIDKGVILFLKGSNLFLSPSSLTVGFRRGEPNRPKKEIFRPPNHCLRFLFFVALFSVRAFLLHLSKRLCHVFHLIPDIKAYVDRRGLLSRHRDTIAGPRIDLDDLLLFQFVLCPEDKSRKIGAALEIVDDYAPCERESF